ncbi:TlpA family protein disulfide reductase [Sphingobacterium composti Ten et al. 2007 non Yoo et al. 2007]|uniref:TlpA family protein disulfide reductase n=1 Tax=Sphingobacterium composti TaxID=363260 RepID=UPI00135ABBDD|nr:TlpA disulfide reductase family protein [Sphingobacterium composti Ten et al. 2007 non Yoo et al. 2007]
MKNIFWMLVLLLSITLPSYAQEWKVEVGEQTPKFVVKGKKDKVFSSESLKGKVVLLNFFATWCPPCREELPRLQREIWDELKTEKDLAVFVLGREEGWDKLDPFMEKHNYTFPIFPDLKREVFGLFADQSIPRNVILDRTGKIIYQSIGFENEEFSKMVKLIKAELQKK